VWLVPTAEEDGVRWLVVASGTNNLALDNDEEVNNLWDYFVVGCENHWRLILVQCVYTAVVPRMGLDGETRGTRFIPL
jgi:hypothetical protein